VAGAEPRPASVPPNGGQRFSVVVEGVNQGELIHTWSSLCQPGPTPPAPEFSAIYPYVTTVQGNRFRFRGGQPEAMRDNLQRLLKSRFAQAPVRAHVEQN
jgi:hypothetical protein